MLTRRPRKMRTPILQLCPLIVLLAAGCGQRNADETAPHGADKPTMAAEFSEQVEAVLQRKTDLVEKLAAEPELIEAVKAANEEHKGITTSEIMDLDEKWQAAEGLDDFMKALMTNECAQRLVDFQADNDGFSEVFVTDTKGLIVAETNKTSDYYQADEDWWVDAYQEGAGKSYHGEIEYDESAMLESISIYVPVRDPEAGTTIGVIKAVCDITVIKMEL
jgi:hypothetical protein